MSARREKSAASKRQAANAAHAQATLNGASPFEAQRLAREAAAKVGEADLLMPAPGVALRPKLAEALHNAALIGWQAHTADIVSLAYLSGIDGLISASKDYTVSAGRCY